MGSVFTNRIQGGGLANAGRGYDRAQNGHEG